MLTNDLRRVWNELEMLKIRFDGLEKKQTNESIEQQKVIHQKVYENIEQEKLLNAQKSLVESLRGVIVEQGQTVLNRQNQNNHIAAMLLIVNEMWTARFDRQTEEMLTLIMRTDSLDSMMCDPAMDSIADALMFQLPQVTMANIQHVLGKQALPLLLC